MENVVGIFKEKRIADSVIEELRAAGFAPDLAKMLNNRGWVWRSAVWPVAQPV
jgi:hypothetical protein